MKKKDYRNLNEIRSSQTDDLNDDAIKEKSYVTQTKPSNVGKELKFCRDRRYINPEREENREVTSKM